MRAKVGRENQEGFRDESAGPPLRKGKVGSREWALGTRDESG